MSTTDDFDFDNHWSDAERRIDEARECYERGRWHDALRALQAAIDINPANSSWLFNKALTLDTLECYADAIETYLCAHELNPEDPEILNCLAVDYTRTGQYDLALETFEKLAGMVPEFEQAYCNRIITYAEMGDHQQAEHMFYLARQLKEHCPLCYYNIGNSLFARQLYDRAIWCWEQTRQLDPSHPYVEYRIAQAHWAQGNHRQARNSFIAELRRSPGDIEVLLDTGILLLEMNDLSAAREKFHRILEMDPDQSQAHHYLGEIQLHRGNITQAVEFFNRALVLDPSQPGSHYRLGDCHIQLGQIPNAREHLLAELALSPDNLEVLLDLGCLLGDVDQHTEAIQCFECVTELAPDDPRGYHHLSLCYYQSGLADQGTELSLKVLELDPNHVPALHNLAFACLQTGAYAQAAEFAQRGCQLQPEDRELRKLKRSIALRTLVHQVTTIPANLSQKSTR